MSVQRWEIPKFLHLEIFDIASTQVFCSTVDGLSQLNSQVGWFAVALVATKPLRDVGRRPCGSETMTHGTTGGDGWSDGFWGSECYICGISFHQIRGEKETKLSAFFRAKCRCREFRHWTWRKTGPLLQKRQLGRITCISHVFQVDWMGKYSQSLAFVQCGYSLFGVIFSRPSSPTRVS